MSGVTQRDRVRINEIKKMCGCKRSLSSRDKEMALKWYEHIIKMERKRSLEKIYQADYMEDS